jgi:hypothetical protein
MEGLHVQLIKLIIEEREMVKEKSCRRKSSNFFSPK